MSLILSGLIAFIQIERWTWKLALFRSQLFSIIVIGILVLHSHQLGENNQALVNSKSELISKNEALIAEKIKRDGERDVLAIKTRGSETDYLQTANQFADDWDVSDFNTIGDDIFCPKEKGKNNYQRMVYKNTTPLTLSVLSLKFEMLDQNKEIPNYAQRVVVGMQQDKAVISEYDIPTRESQVVNFREASESGELVSGGPGRPISSPIKDKSVINLKFQTKYKFGSEVTQILELSYISGVAGYDDENSGFSNDIKINDANPESARGNLFIGSYWGGCIKVTEWSVN